MVIHSTMQWFPLDNRKIEPLATKVNRSENFMQNYRRFSPAVIAAIVMLFLPSALLLSQKTPSKKEQERIEREREKREMKEERKRAARERAAARNARSRPKGVAFVVEPVEGATDTVKFHIGSPLFLRLRIPAGNDACKPFNGRPFIFDSSGAQLGWGFEEVTDSLLFPTVGNDCERILMLSSEQSNKLPEGRYTLYVELMFDAQHRLTSNTIAIHPVYSKTGADALSYSRFLAEQIVRDNPLLRDPETLRALFAEGVPTSAESELYRAIIMLRAGDAEAAREALSAADIRANAAGQQLPVATAALRKELERVVANNQ